MVIYPKPRGNQGNHITSTKVAIPMNTELSTNSKPREVYKSTCENCVYRGDREAEQDWAAIPTSNKNKMSRIIEVGKFPVRCTPCDTKSRRYSRMGATLRKIYEIKQDLDLKSSKKFSRPKMMTIQNSEQLSKEEFTRRLKIFHRDCPWVIGGTFVKELGTKPMGEYAGMWHSHGVYIAPYFEEWPTEEVESYGLHLGKYKEAKIDKNYTDSALKNYIAKYMCKDGGRKQSVGALYRCVREEIEILDSDKVIKVWKQPNKNYQTQMKEWIKSKSPNYR